MTRLQERFEPFLKKMTAEDLPQIVIDNFRHYYERLTEGQTGLIPETDILPLDDMPDIEKEPVEKLSEIGRKNRHKAVIVKLNGGLGTSMGMERAKSLLTVKGTLSFLDIIVRQIQCMDKGIPILFMDSFATRNDTLQALAAYRELEGTIPLDFLQHKIPKVVEADLGPLDLSENPELEWCPPGHGDIYPSLMTSGILDKLLAAGYEYAFVSNSDNLGAVMTDAILGYFVENGLHFMMEAADRTEIDKKGGHLARLKSGRYVLREIAQCPDKDVPSFQDIKRHRYFNTNNIWFHLPSVKDLMEKKKGVLGLPMIRNRKTADPRDPESTPVYQLETAMGAAITIFDSSGCIRVPRTRFAPVKNTNDLLAVRSDCYVLNDKFQVVLNPERSLNRLFIDLDSRYYKLVDDYERRFPFGPPSLKGCESLRVTGDFKFGRDVTLKGPVVLTNNKNKAFEIEDGVCIQGKPGKVFKV